MIIEFTNENDARLCVHRINAYMAAYLRDKGYDVAERDGAFDVTGKNAMTGRSDPLATRTLFWDDVHESPEGTFYIASGGDGMFQAQADVFVEGIACTIRDCPPEWIEFPKPQGLLGTLRTFSKRLFGVAEV